VLFSKQLFIKLDAFFYIFWEKKVLNGREMELIDPTMKMFKFQYYVNPSGRLHLTSVVEDMVNYNNLRNEVYLHLNYVFENVFLYMIFSLEGMKLDYASRLKSSSGTVHYPTNTIDNDNDVSLIKQLSSYDVEGSSLVIVFVV